MSALNAAPQASAPPVEWSLAAPMRRLRGPNYYKSKLVCAHDGRALVPGDKVVQADCRHVLHESCSLACMRTSPDGHACSCSMSRKTMGSGDSLRRWLVPGAPPQPSEPPLCGIDGIPLREGDDSLQLPCAHIFHHACIARFWDREGAFACPLDGRPIFHGKRNPLLRLWRVPSEVFLEKGSDGDENSAEDSDSKPKADECSNPDTYSEANRLRNAQSTVHVSGEAGNGSEDCEDTEEDLRAVLARFEGMEVRTWDCERGILSKVIGRKNEDSRLRALRRELLEERVRFLLRREEILTQFGRIERTLANRKELDDSSCVICLEKLERGEEVITLPCMHVFHTTCILKHLRETSLPRCPLCKTPMERADVELLPVWNWRSSSGKAAGSSETKN